MVVGVSGQGETSKQRMLRGFLSFCAKLMELCLVLLTM